MSKSKVLRIVNLAENVDDRWLENYIQETVPLMGKIKKIYIKKDESLSLIFAYVIFELIPDALKTVQTLKNPFHDYNNWDVSLIGPLERYTTYEGLPEEEYEDDELILPKLKEKKIKGNQQIRKHNRVPWVPKREKVQKQPPRKAWDTEKVQKQPQAWDTVQGFI